MEWQNLPSSLISHSRVWQLATSKNDTHKINLSVFFSLQAHMYRSESCRIQTYQTWTRKIQSKANQLLKDYAELLNNSILSNIFFYTPTYL